MDIDVFSQQQLPIALGALIALVPRLSLRQQRFLQSVVRAHHSSLALAELQALSNELAAVVIPAPGARTLLVQLAAVMALVDGRPSRALALAVERLARTLAVVEPAVASVRQLAERRDLRVRIGLMRRVMGRFMLAAWREQGLRGPFAIVAALLGLGRDPMVAARYAALASFAIGSVGRSLFEHCRSQRLLLPGQAGAVPERMLFHDIGHLLSGYGTDPRGEIRQAAFQAGFVREDGFAFLFFGIVQFHLGVRITPIAAAEFGYFDVEAVMEALARGARCTVDLSDRFDFWSIAQRPLDEVRAQFGIEPARALPSVTPVRGWRWMSPQASR